MTGARSLTPPSVEVRAERFKRLGVAFGNRFLLLLLIGLGWVALAFVEKRFVWGLFAWDALVVIAWAIDLARLPGPSKLTLRRSWKAPVALSVPASVEIALINGSGVALHAKVFDRAPTALRREPAQIEIHAPALRTGAAAYDVLPSERGEAVLGRAYVRYQSVFRLAERWASAGIDQKVRIYPNLDEAKRQSIYLARNRQVDMERRRSRLRGLGREFESLREYREGDEFRDVCWTASARRGKLVTRLYQIERSQTIWLVIDSGRLMRARVDGLSKLDHAVNAALSLAQVALNSGDRVGLLAYSRGTSHRVPAARGSAHLRTLMEELAMIREHGSEADHLRAAGRLLADQKRRSLIVWLTDLAETAMTPEVIEAASRMMPRHLVLLAVIGQPDLAEMADRTPSDIHEMYRVAAAQEVAHRRELLLARLREHGALAIEVNSAALSTALVNSYLEVKERNRL